SVSVSLHRSAAGISTYPRLCRDIDKSGGHHRTRRTAAMVSLNVTSDLAYQAAVLGWMNPPDLFKLLRRAQRARGRSYESRGPTIVVASRRQDGRGFLGKSSPWTSAERTIRESRPERRRGRLIGTPVARARLMDRARAPSGLAPAAIRYDTRPQFPTPSRASVACRHTTPAKRASSSGLQDQ